MASRIDFTKDRMAISHHDFMAESHYAWNMNDESAAKNPVQAGDKYIVRFPVGMRDRMADAAKQNNRSMNAEIVARLDDSFGAEIEADSSKRLMRGHMALLSTLANYVVLKLRHGKIAAGMDDAMLRIAESIGKLEPGTDLMEAVKEPFTDYVVALTDAVNEATKLLGPGWGRKENLERLESVAHQARAEGSLVAVHRKPDGELAFSTTPKGSMPVSDPLANKAAMASPAGAPAAATDAGGRNRTGTGFTPGDFESPASGGTEGRQPIEVEVRGKPMTLKPRADGDGYDVVPRKTPAPTEPPRKLTRAERYGVKPPKR